MSSQGGPASPPAWGAAFDALRAQARAKAETLGTPTNALEDWRYVRLAPLKEAIATAPMRVDVAAIDAHALAGAASLVLIDGAYRADLANIGAMPVEVAVADLASLPSAEAATLIQRWMGALEATADVTACWALVDHAGGVRLRVRGLAGRPLHVLSFSTGGRSAGRVVIELERGAAMHLVVSEVALGRARSTVAFDVEVGDGASLRVDELQRGPAAATSHIFPLLRATLGRDATLVWNTARAGAELGRARFEVELRAPGAALELGSLAVLAGTSQWHDVVRVRHAAGANASSQLFKNVADGSATASFDGLVTIDRGADQANAEQRNQNLLLSPGARVDTRPQLDIFADDVKAGHGATVGQLSADELFYLRARGLPLQVARDLLMRGFAGEVAQRLRLPAARALVEREMMGRLAVG